MTTTAHLTVFIPDDSPDRYETHVLPARRIDDTSACVTLPYVWPAPRITINGTAAQLRNLADALLDAADKADAEDAKRTEALQHVADGRDRCETCAITRDYCTAIHVNTGKRCCTSCHHVPASVPATGQEVPAA